MPCQKHCARDPSCRHGTFQPKKRGRPAKTEAAATTPVESPRKHGRPSKKQADESIAQIDQAIKRGRRSIAAAEEVVAEAPVPTKKRAGRPAKSTAIFEVAVAPKKRGGRFAKKMLLLKDQLHPNVAVALRLTSVASPDRRALQSALHPVLLATTHSV